MSKKVQYFLLMSLMIVSTGCQTIGGAATGAANGLSQDVQNVSNPDANGWNDLRNIDAWMQKNMW